jgi:hypothetical protein
MEQDGVVRAAGGVVSRRNERGEVDAVRWLGIPAAANLLSYLGDRELLAAFAAR